MNADGFWRTTSVPTPLVSTHIDTKLAVAVVSIPHFIGTFLRLLRLRKDRSLALTFGAASAIGGLGGALLNAYANGPILGYVLGALLVFAGLSGMTGFAEQIELKGPWKWIGGFASAGFGGLVGNQGGIRSAAMLGFDLSKESFVATATVIALVVDGARMPVYFVTEHEGIISAWQTVLTATAGVVAGTFAGSYLLDRIAEGTFKRVVSVLPTSVAFSFPSSLSTTAWHYVRRRPRAFCFSNIVVAPCRCASLIKDEHL